MTTTRTGTPHTPDSVDGRARIIIEGVQPEIDCGLFPVKRTVGEKVVVEADVFADGHDVLDVRLLHGPLGPNDRVEPGASSLPAGWHEVDMRPLVNDRWRAEFTVTQLGRWGYTLVGWVDHFLTWRRDLFKRHQAGQDLTVEWQIGAGLVAGAAGRAAGDDVAKLLAWGDLLRGQGNDEEKVRLVEGEELLALMRRYADRSLAVHYPRVLEAVVDRERARFSAWYEMFPRSTSPDPGRPGTFRDCIDRLNYVASMGFDVLYLPPIHPIGVTHRKGRNNATTCEPGDVGSPWAIGAKEGGHKAINPDLGTLEDFRQLVARARQLGIDVALDVALQCSPDHPYVAEHPEWFRRLPDGTIRYAENPPKKYQDIYPFDYESEDWQGLWQEGKSIFDFWIEQGVRIFRVDNPHTKAFRFWQWAITEIKKEHPDVIFLSEAFTRPKVMYRLAKLGFTQSYTYFAWRNTKHELTQYFTELTQTQVREFFRPNLWPNTPDILTEFLQYGGRPGFLLRFILAATLGASYGIYGPAFELCVHQARSPGSEEYLDSEKYEYRYWNLDDPDSLHPLIARVNQIRKDNPALHSDRNLRFHEVDNDQMICYSKHTDDMSNIILVVVNLSPYHKHSGWIHIRPEDFGLDPTRSFQVHDLLADQHFQWTAGTNYAELDPHIVPAHVFRIRRFVRSEHNFEYYL